MATTQSVGSHTRILVCLSFHSGRIYHDYSDQQSPTLVFQQYSDLSSY